MFGRLLSHKQMASPLTLKVLHNPPMELDSQNEHIGLKVIVVQVLGEVRVVNEIGFKQSGGRGEESSEFRVCGDGVIVEGHVFKDDGDAFEVHRGAVVVAILV